MSEVTLTLERDEIEAIEFWSGRYLHLSTCEAINEKVKAALAAPEDHPASQGEEREPDLSEVRCSVCDRPAAFAKEIGSICAFVRPGRVEVCRGVLLAPDSTQKGQS